MKSSDFQYALDTNKKYARYELTANIGNVRLSALCVSEEHKEKTLKHWAKLRAKNIVIMERVNVPVLLTFQVEVRTSCYPVVFTTRASSIDAVKTQLKKGKYKPWQIMTASITNS